MRRSAAAALALAAAFSTLPTTVEAATHVPGDYHDCLRPDHDPEIYGPTDLNAQSSNQRLAVGLNRAGTVTVFRWPRPSYYDQIKYRTTDRHLPRFGAAANDGAFLGLAVHAGGRRTTTWLRDWPSRQRYADDMSDAMRTAYSNRDLGLRVTVTDLVPNDLDVLARNVEVRRERGSPVRSADLVAFENFNLVVSKIQEFPAQDWCFEDQNVDVAHYDSALDAIVHSKSGVDGSTGQPSTVAVGMAFAGRSSSHQVGGDSSEVAGALPGATADAYDDAADGALSGNDDFAGQTTGALATPLDLRRGVADQTLLIAAASTDAGVGSLLTRARASRFDDLATAKHAWFARLLAHAAFPATPDPTIAALARRALVTLVSNYDPRSGAIVASIATQSPYGEDWIRDGAFFNDALDEIGLHDWVRARNDFYAANQSRAERPRADLAKVPAGNWSMNYYADGVPGGFVAIPWEIDETGYGIWTMWHHYEATGDPAYLRRIYPSIRAAADWLVICRDPSNGLQCVANEDDHINPTQSIVGAGPVWMGLNSAAAAARAVGQAGDATRYAARRDELGRAIDGHAYAADQAAYGGGDAVLVWPVCFRPFDDPRMAKHLEAVWQQVAPTFDEPAKGRRRRGQYEGKALLALAHAWKGDRARMARVQRGLTWVAHHHATPDTHVMGEVWIREGGRIVSIVSQPHLWEQVLFYLASVRAWPAREETPRAQRTHTACGGALG